jgi:cytochrome c
MKAFWLSLTVAALVFPAGDAFSATPKEAGAIIRVVSTITNAVQFYKDNGKAIALAEFNNPNGRFNYVELYIFAYDMTGTVVAEPRNKSLVGRHFLNLPDAEGKLYVKAIVDMATERGRGSVSYSFENPDTEGVDLRRIYFQRVDDVIICCVVSKPGS